MKKYLIVLLLFIISSCDNSSKMKDCDEVYKGELYKIIFDTPAIKSKLIQLFDIDGTSPKVFNILISRSEIFTRITITQIFYKFELEELPYSFIKYKKCLFLYYNGNEMILNKSIERNELNKILLESNIKLKNSSIYDSRILQFDLFKNDEIKINDPPVNQFDESEERIKFIPKPQNEQ